MPLWTLGICSLASMGAHAGCLHPRHGGGKGEQPFTATALLGSADRPGFTSVGECAGVRHMGISVGALEAWLEQGERFYLDICAWAELSTTWLTRDAVSLLLGLLLGKALSP